MFPGYLIWKGAYSNPETVDAVPVEPDNPLLRGASGVVPWRLDDKCEIVQLSANHPIDVLVRSRQLAKEDPNNLGILAASIYFWAWKGSSSCWSLRKQQRPFVCRCSARPGPRNSNKSQASYYSEFLSVKH